MKPKEPHPYMDKPRFSNTQFLIKHYAGAVTYNTDSFLDKNKVTHYNSESNSFKDFLVPEHISMMEKSSVPFLRNLFEKFWESQGMAQGKGGSKPDTKSGVQFVSVGSQFKVKPQHNNS
jgi:myosin-5